ncbi:hypothetical protein LUZ61_008709 [Rhynchospora tenuis]|uniref:CCHC-type domain-containing protein n=1 Tax=Rhynchospora tenuis TaxID=198213 RepID=A0AAD5ZVV3_9POAL|nr:hypothetical protein LUZ61_008709 [Rhynchospora tenuis]
MGPNTTTPTIQDQIRGYRLGARLRYEAQRRLPGRSRSYNRTLESQMSPDAELNISQYRRAQQVPAETLYRAGWSENQHRVYQHYSDERVLVTEGQQIELPFITEGSFQTLLQEGLQHLHIGMIMVRLYTLHRRNAGVNALVLLRDTRWRDSRAVISSMEMDLSSGTQLAYTAPDITLSIHDFRDHIQLVIQTHGYEGWQGGESNLLLSRSLIGRLSNTSHTNFRYNVQNVADHLASRGVRAIPGTPRTTEELQERQWIIRPAIISRVQIPQDANIHTRTDGSLSIRFANYTTTAPPNNDIQRGTADEEELEQESINLLTPDEYWPWEINEELGELPEEFGELPEIPENWPNDETILGAWFTNMLRLEEPAIEYLEPIYPYVWCDQFDDTDPIIQFISEEISWAELVDNEQYWHQDEQALMMTCQWDESDEDESDELEHFLNALHSPTEPDLLSLLVGQGGKDCGLPQIPQVSDESEIRWDPEPSESIYVVEDMEYPLLKQLIQKESVFSTAESALTRMPSEPIMGPAMYPPASSSRQPTGLQVPEIRARLNNIRGGYANQMNERYNLPSAQANQGAILVLPEDIGLYEDVLKDLTFCSQIPVPGYYQKSKRYGLRKSKTYRGKPHDTHIRVFKKKHSDKVRKCKCFICGEEGHFARECKKQQGNIARAAIVDNLDLDDDWDVLSVDLNEPDSDAICSFSEGEGSNGTTFTASIENLPYESAFMLNTTSSWRYIVPLPEEMKNCVHEWEDNSPIPAEHIRCKICKDVTNQKMRAHCVRCFLTVCPMCSRFQLRRQLIIQKSTLQYDSKDALIRELVEYANFLLAENQRLKERILELELSTEMKELPKTDKGKGLDIPRGYVEELDYDIPQSSKGITIKMMNDEYISTQVPDPQRGRRVLNRLYNIKIQIEIPGCEKFAIQAILDTGATICCVDEGAIPEAALEPSAAMQGGLRIEGQMVTFYKNITTIATKVEAEVASAVSISELDLTELEFQEIQRAVAYPCGDKPLKHITPAMNEQFNKHIQALLKIGVIRPSKSRHRTMAMMVNSGTSIDPKTGQEVKENEEQHAKHLETMLAICEKWGLVLSPTKMKIAVPEIEFLGAVIGHTSRSLEQSLVPSTQKPVSMEIRG